MNKASRSTVGSREGSSPLLYFLLFFLIFYSSLLSDEISLIMLGKAGDDGVRGWARGGRGAGGRRKKESNERRIDHTGDFSFKLKLPSGRNNERTTYFMRIELAKFLKI